MAKIKWTPKAVEQLEQIIDFISKNSPHYATLTARQIFKRIRLLKKNSRLGRKVPERNDPSIRELIHNRYRIVYPALFTNLGSTQLKIISNKHLWIYQSKTLFHHEVHEGKRTLSGRIFFTRAQQT